MSITKTDLEMDVLMERSFEKNHYYLLELRFRKIKCYGIVIEEQSESAIALFGSDRSMAEHWFLIAAEEGLAAIHLEDFAKDCAFEAEFS